MSLRLAYLCNVYPAVSHSFVRREIEGIERAGHTVHRFTLRPPASDLRDEADISEAQKTEGVLAKGALRLGTAALALMISRPRRTCSSIAQAWRLSRHSGAKLRHAAYWLEAAWLVRRFRQLRIHHLHAHFGTNPASVAAIVRAWGGPPFSFTAHGPDEFDAPLKLSLAEKVTASTFVAAISSYGRSQLMRWCDPAEWTKIKVVRCGLGEDFLEQTPVPSPPASTEFVCVARLAPQKGLPVLVAAAARLARAGEQFTITIVGDGELRSSLQENIERQGIQKHVRLVGVQSAAEIRDHLERARAFVLPSFAEGLPVALMEALALGRPVITTAIAGIPELIDEECGWLISPGSEEALAAAMAKVLQTPAAEINNRGKIGQERVRLFHNARHNAEQLMNTIMMSDPTS